MGVAIVVEVLMAVVCDPLFSVYHQLFDLPMINCLAVILKFDNL